MVKKYEGNMKDYEGDEENMKKYQPKSTKARFESWR